VAIRSWKDRRLRLVFETGKAGKGFPADLLRPTLRKLDALDAAAALKDLDQPGWRLEPLKGEQLGQYSIRVNDQFRLCFTSSALGPGDVEFVDYH
jgi:proteic killer suppression protein